MWSYSYGLCNVRHWFHERLSLQSIVMRLPKAILCLLLLGAAPLLRADDARFDLPGPKIDVYVTRGNVTLPSARVTELQPNDQLRIKTDLPSTQSNHLLLIVAFLRGTTNEPPDNWFTKIETWKPSPPAGTLIIVPDGAQVAKLFVAPETGGDFNTLRSAVKGESRCVYPGKHWAQQGVTRAAANRTLRRQYANGRNRR